MAGMPYQNWQARLEAISGTTFDLTHWGWVTMHICIGRLTIIGSDNGLSPGQGQAIIWTNAGILLIEPSGTNFSELLKEFQTFSLKKIHLKMLSAKYYPFRLGLSVLTLNVRGPSYLGLTRSISWLLMPWLLTSPGHQQPRYDYIGYAGPYLTWGRILRTCVISLWRNGIKCRYMFIFPLKNSARKGLIDIFDSWSDFVKSTSGIHNGGLLWKE